MKRKVIIGIIVVVLLIATALIVLFCLNREEVEILPPVEFFDDYSVELSPEGDLNDVKTATIKKTSEMLEMYKVFPPIVSQLVNLEELDFSRTEISDLTAIQHLKQLKQIISRENGISDLSGFGYLPSLVSLDMETNELSDLRGIENFPNLVSLNISDNKLSDLRGIENLKKLEYLDLNCNFDLSNLSGIENLQKLQSLRLFGNSKLSDLREVGRLKNLTELIIGPNRFESFPLEILHLENLNKLLMESLEFRSFPDSFYTSGLPIEVLRIGSMHNFDYSSNLPHFHKLEKLRELHLRDDIPILNINFAKCERLEEFTYVYRKKIDIADAMKRISRAPKLKRLILSKNRFAEKGGGISYLPKEIALCDSLESLVLSDNNIKKIPKSITKLQNLKLVDLRRNPIDTIAIKEIEKEMVNTTFYYDRDRGNVLD